MKKSVASLLILVLVIFTSCIGEQGPPGKDGESLTGSIFEITGDFKAQNNYELFFEFPTNFEIYSSDIVMVYILWEQVNGSDGKTIDVWRALPQTIILNEGVLQYNFDYTKEDVKVFLDGTVDFNTLLPAEKNNQTFRIAVLPAAFAENKSIDIKNLETVMNLTGVDDSSIKRINF
jgi:hypothetical protein